MRAVVFLVTLPTDGLCSMAFTVRSMAVLILRVGSMRFPSFAIGSTVFSHRPRCIHHMDLLHFCQ